jgi:hypothetical protein
LILELHLPLVINFIIGVILIVGGAYLINISLKNPRPDWVGNSQIRLFGVAISLVILGLMTLFELMTAA